MPLGFDQWFRFFIPVGDENTLNRLPAKLDTLAYARYLTIAKSVRPVLRNYTVRAFRPDGPGGPELDVDFVLHGSIDDGTSGPAATWAQTCAPGEAVALLDEGIMFAPAAEVSHVRIVADETGLPAVEGVLASLGEGIGGTVIVEVGNRDDRRDLASKSSVDVEWIVRDELSSKEDGVTLGRLAAARARSMPQPSAPSYSWVVGESSMVVGLRRHWVAQGTAKTDVTFCGYWKQQH